MNSRSRPTARQQQRHQQFSSQAPPPAYGQGGSQNPTAQRQSDADLLFVPSSEMTGLRSTPDGMFVYDQLPFVDPRIPHLIDRSSQYIATASPNAASTGMRFASGISMAESRPLPPNGRSTMQDPFGFAGIGGPVPFPMGDGAFRVPYFLNQAGMPHQGALLAMDPEQAIGLTMEQGWPRHATSEANNLSFAANSRSGVPEDSASAMKVEDDALFSQAEPRLWQPAEDASSASSAEDNMNISPQGESTSNKNTSTKKTANSVSNSSSSGDDEVRSRRREDKAKSARGPKVTRSRKRNNKDREAVLQQQLQQMRSRHQQLQDAIAKKSLPMYSTTSKAAMALSIASVRNFRLQVMRGMMDELKKTCAQNLDAVDHACMYFTPDCVVVRGEVEVRGVQELRNWWRSIAARIEKQTWAGESLVALDARGDRVRFSYHTVGQASDLHKRPAKVLNRPAKWWSDPPAICNGEDSTTGDTSSQTTSSSASTPETPAPSAASQTYQEQSVEQHQGSGAASDVWFSVERCAHIIFSSDNRVMFYTLSALSEPVERRDGPEGIIIPTAQPSTPEVITTLNINNQDNIEEEESA